MSAVLDRRHAWWCVAEVGGDLQSCAALGNEYHGAQFVEAESNARRPPNKPERSFASVPLFRVIYTSRTHFRLMETAAGDPEAWRVQMPTVPSDPNSVVTVVRDIVTLVDDVPVHRGIELSVLTEGSDIDDAIARAFSKANTLLTVLSASSRAPAEPLRPFVAFDASPDLVERTLVQWFPDLDYPIGKTPVPQTAFDALLQCLPAAGEKAAPRLMLSLAWHRQALLATEPLFRFLPMDQL